MRKTAPESSPQPSPFRRGLALLYARKFRAARKLLAKASLRGDVESVWACQELIQTFLRSGESAAAEPFLRQLLAADDALLQHALGYLYRRLGRSDEALAILSRASNRRPRLHAIDNELGWLLCERHRDDEGLKLLRRSERHYRRVGDSWGLATTLTHQATLSVFRIRLGDALRQLEQARAVKVACGDRLGLQTVTHNTAVVLMYLGRYVEAIESFEAARDIARSIGDIVGRGFCDNQIGLCYLYLLELDAAQAACLRARRVFARCGLVEREAITRGNLAQVSHYRGRFGQAVRRYQGALRQLADSAMVDAIGTFVASLAQALCLASRPAEALQYLDRYAERLAGVDLRTGILLARERARALVETGASAAAAVEAQRSLDLGRSLPAAQRGLSSDLVEAQTILGRALLASGSPVDRRNGQRALRAAARGVEGQLTRLHGSAARMGLLELHRRVHDVLVESLVRAGRWRSAWVVAAQLKARELRYHRAAVRSAARETDRLRLLASEIEQLAVLPTPNRSDLQRLRDLRRRYLELTRRAGDVEPRRSVRQSTRLGVRLGPDTVLVEYHVMRHTTMAFVVRDHGVFGVDLGCGERRLGNAIRRLLAPILGAARDPRRRRELLGFELKRAHRLHQSLVAPILARLPSSVEKLIVVPDGPLHGLPFELLVSELGSADERPAAPWGAYAKATYLGDAYTIRYTPSSLLVGREDDVSGRSTRVLAMAYSPDAHMSVQFKSAAIDIAPLPGVGEEVVRVAALFRTTTLLSGTRASPAAFERYAPGHDIVHIAAHAFADTEAPGLSGIVLASDDRSGRPELLTASRLARSSIRAQLVTLSACDTGRGRVRGREGVLGLVRALFEADVSAVIASLWPVDDATSAALMERFYRRLGEGLDRATALAQARIDLRRDAIGDGVRVHPAFWAPFVLIEQGPIGRE